jgi:hypothetical protein
MTHRCVVRTPDEGLAAKHLNADPNCASGVGSMRHGCCGARLRLLRTSPATLALQTVTGAFEIQPRGGGARGKGAVTSQATQGRAAPPRDRNSAMRGQGLQKLRKS